MDSRLAVFEEKMGKSLANLEEEFAGIRAGRANPHVLGNTFPDSECGECKRSGTSHDSDSAMGSIYG